MKFINYLIYGSTQKQPFSNSNKAVVSDTPFDPFLFQLASSSSYKYPTYSAKLKLKNKNLNFSLQKKNIQISVIEMSMSIFSSFEALCAETFYGQKVAPLSTPPISNYVKIDDLMNKDKEVSLSPSQPKDRRRTRATRFAPELDGLHCFETIIPY
ncbi:hypothetical protein CASFOL_003418 [Castilleja foliolosa]|uniref:Uncharacterized protein n=1 Tax=Castilleja foliolosa TaxID=1961234 RepID=A0ABD3EJ09_9LAMI